MPLLDHFHPPLSTQRHWESFHTTWASSIADSLNQDWLPEGYFAEEQLHPVARVEIDVAAFEEPGVRRGGATTLSTPRTYLPPAPQFTIPNVVYEGVEVLLYASEGGPTLVGAVELVSPANKDRPETRRAFVAKCASYLQHGVGLAIVDIVTSRSASLHAELLALLGTTVSSRATGLHPLYAVAYRPVRRGDADALDVWPNDLLLGQPLPDLPLWVGADLVVPIKLEATYQAACARRRLL